MRGSWKGLSGFAAVMAVLVLPDVSRACFMYAPQPIQVWNDDINVEIRDLVAVKKYNCVFLNPNAQAVVGGECYMEVEPGAQVDNMSMEVDGKKTEAEILDVGKANKVFQEIIQRGGSPALLEYYGNQLIHTRVPSVPPNGTVTINLQYTTVLKPLNGLVRMQMLNTNPKAEMKALQHAGVKVKITSTQPIKGVYSPTHPIKVLEDPTADVKVEWEENNYLPKTPFVLYYSLSDQPIGASAVAHREGGEKGSFMAMISPTIGKGKGKVEEKDILSKDVVFCIDTSGSMLDKDKMEQARKALELCVGKLRSNDRFNIVDFSTEARLFHPEGLLSATDENKAKGLEYVKKLRAKGGTAIQEALEKSLEMLTDENRLKMVLFSTDGLPNVGEQQPDALVKLITNANKKGVRIFAFGEGIDVNAKLLDQLAFENRGESDYILPEEDIAQKMGGFFDRIGSPLMSDIQVSFSGSGVEEVYPKALPDLYTGQPIFVYGRYSAGGNVKVSLQGKVNGETKKLDYDLVLPEENPKNEFVERLWAGRKVHFLLGEIKKAPQGQDSKELVDDVVALAKQYGIVTPYTAYLVNSDFVANGPGFLGGQGGGAALRRQVYAEAAKADAPAPSAAPGDRYKYVSKAKRARNADKGLAEGKAYEMLEAADAEMQASGEKDGLAMKSLRYIGTKTFYLSQGVWYDSAYDPEKVKDLKEVKIGSDEFMKLLADSPGFAKYMALGDVVVEYKKVFYKFVKAPAAK